MEILRKTLHWLMAQVSFSNREIITMEWSDRSIVHNAFRIYEYLFGRREGIRRESSASAGYIDGELVVKYKFFTLESLLVYGEGVVREFFEKEWIPIRIVELRFAIPNSQLQIPFISFAIANESATNGSSAGSATVTYSYAISGSNRYIAISGAGDGTISGSSASYNSVPATGLTITQWIPAVRGSNLFFLANPTTGTNNVSVTMTGATATTWSVAANYSGAQQTTPPDSSNFGTGTAVSTYTLATTVVGSNCWLIAAVAGTRPTASAGAQTFIRALWNSDNETMMLDSNGTVGTGSQALTTTYSPAASWGSGIISISPAITSQIKKVSSVSLASIKKISKVAIASVKKVAGVANT